MKGNGKEDRKELIAWLEWQKQVYLGRARESVGEYPRPSGIACPNGKRRFGFWVECRRELTATEIVIDCGVEQRRVLYCPKCKKWFCAMTGRDASDE